jgi:FkbM family methyltransferase
MTEPVSNHWFDSSPTLLAGSTSAMASLVMPTRMPSTGTIRTFTRNAEATEAKPSARPARGWRPTLRNAAAANGITLGLHHEPFAVSNHNGPVGFRTDLGADSSQVILNPPADFQGVVVQSIRLDDYLAQTGRKLCKKDLLKIDAEGADFDVLRGAEKTIRESAPQIAVTTYHLDEHAADILDWLQKVQPRYRYRLKGFSYWTTTPRPVLLQASALG